MDKMESVLAFLMNRMNEVRIRVSLHREAARLWRELRLAVFFNARFAPSKEQFLKNCEHFVNCVKWFEGRRGYTEEERISFVSMREPLLYRNQDLCMWFSIRSLAILEFAREYERMRSHGCWVCLENDPTHTCNFCYVDMLSEEFDMYVSKKRACEEYPRGSVDLHAPGFKIVLNIDDFVKDRDTKCEGFDDDPLAVEAKLDQEERDAFEMNPSCIM